MAFKPTSSSGSITSGEKQSRQKQQHQIREELVTLQEERVYREVGGTVAIRDIIAPSAFRVESNYIQLGDTFLRTTYIITYPRYISVHWSAPILNLNLTMDVSMFFYPIEAPIILKQLKKKGRCT